jgi:hypothetical protein
MLEVIQTSDPARPFALQRRHRVKSTQGGPLSFSGERRDCAKTGHCQTVRRTGQVDLRPFQTGPVRAENARKRP